MKKKFIKRIIIYLFVVLTLSLIYIPLYNDMKLGLDLKGGFEVLYQVKRGDGKKLKSDDLDSTANVLKRNVDSLGVSEPDITLEGNDRIRVKLAGVTNIESARKVLSKVANVSFRDINDNLLMDSSVIKSAKAAKDDKGKPCISLQIADKEKFLNVTKEISERQSGENMIVIWYNFENGVNSYSSEKNTCGSEESDCLSAANVSQGFSSDVIIQGNFDEEEVKRIATNINSGSITTKLSEISSQNVNASYGQDVLIKTILAGVIGLILVIILMTFLYNFAGFISAFNLLIYILLVLGVFWLIGGVLSLAGIAAFVLGIGMAVDSCVITNERIKEELESGKSLENAYRLGNNESLSSIIDANITTLIVAIVLFIFGESSVKGFATMLIITILSTMFVMVFINKKVLKMFVKTNFFDKNPNKFIKFNINKKENKKINAIKSVRKCLITSFGYILVGIVILLSFKLNLGIDFRAGTDITINAKKLEVEKIKSDFKDLGYKVVEINKQSSNNIYVKIGDELKENGINKVNNYFESKYDAKTEINVVTNVVKKELIKNAIYSLLLAAIGIIIYISFRFKFSYAISSIIALLHDVLVVAILFSIFKIEVNVIFIAAILTIVGYSINNTIVVFDRIRENINSIKKKITKEDLKEVVNKSINETLIRSIYTTITTLIPVVSLILIGSKNIFPFNIAIVFGLFAGFYSSLLLASQIWYLIEVKKINKK